MENLNYAFKIKNSDRKRMTRKASVTNGFISILGAVPAQFALFLTFVASVQLPRDE